MLKEPKLTFASKGNVGSSFEKLDSTRVPNAEYQILPYTGLVAIFVMWPGSFEQTFVPP